MRSAAAIQAAARSDAGSRPFAQFLRRPLAQAPANARPADVQSAIAVACCGARPKATAITAAPSDWPISRPVDWSPEAPPLRSGGALPMMIRLLGDWKKPKPSPQTREAPDERGGARIADVERHERKARAHHHEAGAAEQRRDEPVGEPSGDRGDDGGGERPGGHQQARRRRRAMQRVLEEEGQRHEREALRGEREDRRRQRQGKDRQAQEIDGQERRCLPELAPDEEEAERRGAGEFRRRGSTGSRPRRCRRPRR